MYTCNNTYFVIHEQPERRSGTYSLKGQQAALLNVTLLTAPFEQFLFFFLTRVTASPENHAGTFFPYILTAAYNPSLQREALKTALRGDIISFPFLSQKEQLIIGGGKLHLG